jgi:plastocyanin
MGGTAKTVVVVLVIIAITIPILLGVALTQGLPYSTPTVSAPAVTTTSGASSSGTTVTIPQGAGGAQEANFSPASLTVASGTTVMWTDQDTDAVHNIAFTSVPSGASTPAVSPNLSKGSTFQVTLTTPGTYKYECQYHSGWMQGTIVVTG